MPALFAGGVCCAVLVFEDEAGLLAGDVAGGLLAGAADSLLAAGAAVDLLAGAELAAGAAVGVAAVELFLERDFFVVVAAELSDAAASVLAAALFLDLEVVGFAESAVASVL